MHPSANFVTTVVVFLAYFLEALGLLGLFAAVYVRLTPYRDFDLIRAGNSAAALTLGGAIIGFVLPLASVITHSASLLEVGAWGLVALVVQLGVFLGIRAGIRSLAERIAADNVALAGLVAAVSVGVGALNAACMVP